MSAATAGCCATLRRILLPPSPAGDKLEIFQGSRADKSAPAIYFHFDNVWGGEEVRSRDFGEAESSFPAVPQRICFHAGGCVCVCFLVKIGKGRDGGNEK